MPTARRPDCACDKAVAAQLQAALQRSGLLRTLVIVYAVRVRLQRPAFRLAESRTPRPASISR